MVDDEMGRDDLCCGHGARSHERLARALPDAAFSPWIHGLVTLGLVAGFLVVLAGS